MAAKHVSNRALVVEGARGSMSVAGPDFRRYGGHTTCFSVEVSPGHHLVFDCGTGLQNLQKRLPSGEPQEFTVFLTHYHWDHIQGLPVFLPLFDARNRVRLYGPAFEDRTPQEALDSVMCRPWWPVSLAEASADVEVMALPEAPLEVGGVKISHTRLSHPDGVTGYRIDADKSVVIATDHEAGEPGADARLRELAAGADILIHDGQYTPEEAQGARKGWGHSDWEGATSAAVDAGVGRLMLTSHDPDRTDDGIEDIRQAARTRFPMTDAVHEGMTIPF